MPHNGEGREGGQGVLPLDTFGRDLSYMSTAAQGFVEELEERRFVAVQGIEPDRIQELMHAYADFMSQLPPPPNDYLVERYTDPEGDEIDVVPESDEVKYWHTYRTRLNKPGKPGGQTNRSLEWDALSEAGVILPESGREASDRKEYFHYSPDMYAELVRLHEENNWGPMPPQLLRLLELAEPIHRRSSEIMEDCYEAMEHNVAFEGVRRALVSDPLWRVDSPMRILAYHTDGEGPSLGQLHRDKGTATLALDESHWGLRVSTGAETRYDEEKGGYVLLNREEAAADENMRLVERERGQAAFFVADGFRRETGIGHPAIQPTYHDIVRYGDKEYIPGVIARYAVIFFMNPPSGTFSSKRANHGAEGVAT